MAPEACTSPLPLLCFPGPRTPSYYRLALTLPGRESARVSSSTSGEALSVRAPARSLTQSVRCGARVCIPFPSGPQLRPTQLLHLECGPSRRPRTQDTAHTCRDGGTPPAASSQAEVPALMDGGAETCRPCTGTDLAALLERTTPPSCWFLRSASGSTHVTNKLFNITCFSFILVFFFRYVQMSFRVLGFYCFLFNNGIL